MKVEDIKFCPLHGYPLPCHKCGYDERDEVVNLMLFENACEHSGVNSGKAAIAFTSMLDVLNAVEKYLVAFDEIMIGAGKAKKEGLHTTGLVSRVQDIQTELQMYAQLARMKLGVASPNKGELQG